MKAEAASRLVENLVMKMAPNEGNLVHPFVCQYGLTSSQVTLLFNFRRASRYQAQVRGPPFEPMVWDDNMPRKLLSEDGFTLVTSMPSLMGVLVR